MVDYKKAPDEIELAISESKRTIDFLPAPEDLTRKVEKEEITITINKESLDFFLKASAKYNVPYQTIINNLIENYTKRVTI